MSNDRTFSIDRLRAALDDQYPVKIERNHDWWADHVFGYVVGLSGEWLQVQRLMDSVYEDGMEIVRIADVTEVTDNRENGYIERALSSLGRQPAGQTIPDDARTPEVLWFAAQQAPLISVHLEKEPDHPLLVGKLAHLGSRTFDFQLIGPKGAWEVDPTRWWYKDVTRIQFGDRYSTALATFGDPRPGSHIDLGGDQADAPAG